jgi:hypothetical protein
MGGGGRAVSEDLNSPPPYVENARRRARRQLARGAGLGILVQNLKVVQTRHAPVRALVVEQENHARARPAIQEDQPLDALQNLVAGAAAHVCRRKERDFEQVGVAADGDGDVVALERAFWWRDEGRVSWLGLCVLKDEPAMVRHCL